MADGQIKADTTWMRGLAADTESTMSSVRKLLTTGDEAVAGLKRAAPGWMFVSSVDAMASRWEDLNKLLCDELQEAARNIRFNASSHDGNENIITETWHNLFG